MADENVVDEGYVAALERELEEHQRAGRDERVDAVQAELDNARQGSALVVDDLGPLGAKNEDHGLGEGRAHEAGMVIDENHPDADRVLEEKLRLADQQNLARGGTPEHVANVANVGTDATGRPTLEATVERKRAASSASRSKQETATAPESPVAEES